MQKHIIIIGGGFGGINVCKELANDPNFKVTLVDKNNYNFFPPLIYQVATGFIESSNISYPFRKLFHGWENVHFRLGELKKIIPEENKVILSNGELTYDYLVIATGTETNYFGMENVRKHAHPLKTLGNALAMRNFMFGQIEKASIAGDDSIRKKLTTIVIAGGGPTGVELGGMLAEMKKNILHKDFPELKGKLGEIYLVDAAGSVLPPMSKASQEYTYNTLTKMGVIVRLNMQVKDCINDTVIFANGESIETGMLLWAAGVTVIPIEGIPQESYGRGKRIMVDEFNKAVHTKNIFAIGDVCIQTTDKNFPEGHPQLAQVALQQGTNLAKNFKTQYKDKKRKAFSYYDKGSMAIIGRNKAVADLPKPKLHFNGFIAWCMWILIHLLFLISTRNRIKTLYNWMLAYFTKDQSLRMIIKPSENTP